MSDYVEGFFFGLLLACGAAVGALLGFVLMQVLRP